MAAAADEGPAHAVHGVLVDVSVDPIPAPRVATLPQPTTPFVEKELRRRRHWRRATWHRRHAGSWQRRRAPTLHRLSHETHNFVDTRRGRLDVEVIEAWHPALHTQVIVRHADQELESLAARKLDSCAENEGRQVIVA